MSERPRVLFLDDRSKRIHDAFKRFKLCDLTIVTNVKECLRFLSTQDWDVVYLDHDLGGEEYCDPNSPTCGMEIIRYLEKTNWVPKGKSPYFIVHSSNAFASQLMVEGLSKLGFVAYAKRYEYDSDEIL